MMPGRGGGGLGAGDEGGWGVIYSKLNRGLWEAGRQEKWKICYGLWSPTPTPKCDQPKMSLLTLF